MAAIYPRDFLDRGCTADAGLRMGPRPCDAPAEYVVLDGEVPVLTCARHLLDSIDEVVESSALTVDSEPLGVIRLRDEEND